MESLSQRNWRETAQSVQSGWTSHNRPGGTGHKLHRGLGTGYGLLLVACFSGAFSAPALAIPSPDLATSFLSNAAQLFGLATVVIGGAFAGKRKAGFGGGDKAQARISGWARWLLPALGGLLAVSIASNVLQWSHGVDERNERLQANLVRPSIEAGKRVGDVSLKTLSYSKQIDHPLGMTTEALAQAFETSGRPGAEPIRFIDVREPEEQEVGALEGFTRVRYPDVIALRDKLELAEGRVVLLCESGNRSSELCAKLAAMGIDCRFVVGGVGKWRAEGRTVSRSGTQAAAATRDVADFPNKQTLLDTADVKGLVADGNAVFIDVRYPKDFERGHLPGAINIPLRKLETGDMWAQLGSIPNRPVVAACYDKRSCFYSLILGLRLHRLGHDFRGRYTVPHEYFVPATPKPYETGWFAAEDSGFIATASAPLQQLLIWIEAQVGTLWLAILLLVLLLRVLIMPLTAKAERDQFVLQQLAEQIDAHKQSLKDDPTRLSRAMKAIYRKHRLTPGLNLLGICLQVPLFLVLFFAIDQVSLSHGGAFLWLPTLGQPDTLYILPALLGVAVLLHLQLNAVRRTLKFTALRLTAALALTAITWNLSAGANLYLVASFVLMMLQSQAVKHLLTGRRLGLSFASKPTALADGIVPLALAGREQDGGNKAARLGRMIEAGLPVPEGFVLSDGALTGDADKRLPIQEDARILNAMWAAMDAERVAVRSSGLNEDGADKSYAGVFESKLNVTRDGLPAAIAEVRGSLAAARVSAYAGDGAERGGVVVQKMVPAEYAGVMFTEHPAESGSMLIEMVPGLGDSVTDGAVTPETYTCGRYSGQIHEDATAPIDLEPLLALGRQAEALFGAPQDIEWAYQGGRFFLLQSRDIVVTSRTAAKNRMRAAFETERSRLLEIAAEAPADETVFAQSELSELLPRPTPFSRSFMEALFAPGGSTDLACRALGIPYDVAEDSPSMVETVFGNLFVNRHEERRRLGSGPGLLASFRLSRAADDMEADFRERFLPAFQSEMRLLESLNLSGQTTGEIVDLLAGTCDRFIKLHYVEADSINIAADFYFKLAERELKRRGFSPAQHLAHLPETVVHKAMSMLPEVRAGQRPVGDFLDLFGHRATLDYEFAQPRYGESPDAVEQLVRHASTLPQSGAAASDASAGFDNPSLNVAVERARRFQALKEEAKHHCLREVAVIRRILVELDRRFSLGGGIFYLALEEVLRLRESAYLRTARQRIAERRSRDVAFRQIGNLPSDLSLAELETLTISGAKRRPSDDSGDLQGTLVAGNAPVEGPARVVTDDDIDALEPGEILVARYTQPDWTPAFPRAAGVITEVGGWLSHAAILAREYNIATVVGARGAIGRIQTGDLVRLHPDGRIETVKRATPSEQREGENAAARHEPAESRGRTRPKIVAVNG